MNDRSDRRTRLLAETFHADWANGPAADFARAAAAHARRRRAARAALLATGVVAGVAFVALSHQPAPAPAASSPTTRGYEIISDDELIAQLRDRPLLVLKRDDGAREFVLLDE